MTMRSLALRGVRELGRAVLADLLALLLLSKAMLALPLAGLVLLIGRNRRPERQLLVRHAYEEEVERFHHLTMEHGSVSALSGADKQRLFAEERSRFQVVVERRKPGDHVVGFFMVPPIRSRAVREFLAGERVGLRMTDVCAKSARPAGAYLSLVVAEEGYHLAVENFVVRHVLTLLHPSGDELLYVFAYALTAADVKALRRHQFREIGTNRKPRVGSRCFLPLAGKRNRQHRFHSNLAILAVRILHRLLVRRPRRPAVRSGTPLTQRSRVR